MVIRHPELASSIKTQEDTASSEGQNSDDNNSLQQPKKPAGDLSPFLSAHHFNLNSKNTSMFMAGNFDLIIVGEWNITVCYCCIVGQVAIYVFIYGNISLDFFKWNAKTQSFYFIISNLNTNCVLLCLLGGGEGNALYIDSELNHGRTGRCATFDNPPLCAESFQVSVLEVWGFQEVMAS